MNGEDPPLGLGTEWCVTNRPGVRTPGVTEGPFAVAVRPTPIRMAAPYAPVIREHPHNILDPHQRHAFCAYRVDLESDVGGVVPDEHAALRVLHGHEAGMPRPRVPIRA